MSAIFDLATTPLARGATLIEASAGTGKTFTITGIFLRLVVEESVPVEKILVVTYTDAATAELRERIWRGLSEGVHAFTTGKASAPHLLALLERHSHEAETMLQRLQQALRHFDEAGIQTIHSFCQRMLRERAFESGSGFQMDLVTEEGRMTQEAIQDYWRKHTYPASALVTCTILARREGPHQLFSLVRECLGQSMPRLLGRRGPVPPETVAGELHRAFDDLRALYPLHKTTLSELLTRDTNWANKPYNDPEVVAGAQHLLERCLGQGELTPETLENLAFFSAGAMEAKRNKRGKTPKVVPRHVFFDACEKFAGLQKDYIEALERDCITSVSKELTRRKQKEGIQFFQDLLANLHEALTSPAGPALASAIRNKFDAALIDEFQDTDPLQFDIFRILFPPQESRLYLIGDPKQAIYGFRGADIFTYLKAARYVQETYTLQDNWRSQSNLVQAINTLFGQAPLPFVFPGIEFRPVTARGAADEKPFTLFGREEAPLQIWFNPEAEKGTKGKVQERIAKAVAAEIRRLISGEGRLGSEVLQPSDIAVLVPKHKQARLIQQALSALNIPSVQQTQESVFSSAEAQDLERVLGALAEPSRERLVRGCLTTDLFGLSGLELERMNREESPWQEWLVHFRNYHELWLKRGFIQMFRALLCQQQVRRRWLQLPDGQRRLTNLLHLTEVLQKASLSGKLSPQGLRQWLVEQIAEKGQGHEEHQLRLERDDKAVRLVTIHKSKGLEYPVVFCPFSWEVSARKEALVRFHDPSHDQALTLDLGSADQEAHQELADQEQLAEQMRLLYVALTRARNRCYVVWGNYRDVGKSALAYLLHQPVGGAASAGALLDHVKELSGAQMQQDLEKLAAQSEGRPVLAVAPMPEEPATYYQNPAAEGTLAPRNFSRVLEQNWRITSFTALAHQSTDEAPDHDDWIHSVIDEEAAAGIFAFPRGARAGNCLHQLLETIEFTDSDPEAHRAVVQQVLAQHGYNQPGYEAVLLDLVGKISGAPLPFTHPAITLGDLPPGNRLHELEFYFPLNRVSPGQLQELFARHATPLAEVDLPAELGRLSFQPVAGFMKGFIDLVFTHEKRFYLVDWKSNWLGNRPEDYNREKLMPEMTRQHYVLQYHLYTLALHKYLSLRLKDYDYETHFGGVYYLFLRGADPARPGQGIYFDRPRARFIEALDVALVAPALNSPTA